MQLLLLLFSAAAQSVVPFVVFNVLTFRMMVVPSAELLFLDVISSRNVIFFLLSN